MSETIYVRFPDISGDSSGHTAFLRHPVTGALLNSGGDAIAESGSTGLWSFTLAETRLENVNYDVGIYSGSSESAANLVYDGILRSGLSRVDAVFEPTNKTLIFGTVAASPTPTTSVFTAATITTAPAVLNQWRGRVIMFDNDTVTEELRGQATEILGSSADALPELTVTPLTTAPASTDSFSIV